MRWWHYKFSERVRGFISYCTDFDLGEIYLIFLNLRLNNLCSLNNGRPLGLKDDSFIG